MVQTTKYEPTENDWLSCVTPSELFVKFDLGGYGRRHKLFAFACVRRAYESTPIGGMRDRLDSLEAVFEGERRPDGLLVKMARKAHEVVRTPTMQEWLFSQVVGRLEKLDGLKGTIDLCKSCSEVVVVGSDAAVMVELGFKELAAQTDVLRDTFGSPFLKDPVGPFVNAGLHRLATAAYHERNADGTIDAVCLSAIADALEEEGAARSILDDARAKRPRYRGYWLIDRITGR